jgi:cellobiose phosphorylase
MYQFVMGSLLGIELQKDVLKFKPCFPVGWPSVTINYRHGKASYHITIFQLNNNDESWWKEGEVQGKGDNIKLIDDGITHNVEVHVGQSVLEQKAVKTEQL